MTKVLVATEKPFAEAAVEQIKKIFDNYGYQVFFLEKYTSQEQLINALLDIDALIVRSDKITPDIINAAKDLKIVVRAGAGYDNVNLEAATKNNVVVMNTPGQNSNAVAELAIGMMVYQARNHFNGKSGSELCCKTLGIHAYGNVGKLVSKIAKGFGMSVIAFDPFVDKASIEADGVKVVETIEELYGNCDYISLHIPANEHTIKSINYDHPIISRKAINAQSRHHEINGINKTFYCGAYWGNGFHEDGVKSALMVTKQFGKTL